MRCIPAEPAVPTSGYTYALNASGLSLGSHTITVTATDSDGTPDTGSSSVTVNVQAPLPTVYIDAPAQGSAVSGTVTVSGSAVDNALVVGTAISSVQVKVDGTVVGNRDLRHQPPRRLCGLSRQARLSERGLYLCAQRVRIEPRVSHHHRDRDRQRRNSRHGSSSVTVNVQAPLPTVYIDTPAHRVSRIRHGDSFRVGGGQRVAVGSAINSVQVKVDGTVVGTATYGFSRPDVCAVYPGRTGCPNVGYSYSLNTSALSVGSHTITVTRDRQRRKLPTPARSSVTRECASPAANRLH